MQIFDDLKNLINLIYNENNYIFFSESKYYQKYFIEFIKKFKCENKLIYLSNDPSDIIELNNVKSLAIKNTFILNVAMSIIQANVVFMTMTDLNFNEIKKSKFVKKYIYIFHSPMSTNKIYTATAFKAYDEIYSVGEYQYNELLKLNIDKKKIKKIGYFYFDYLQNNLVKVNKVEKETILIAPSWNLNKKNFLTIYAFQLIKHLIDSKEYKIIFRPHPEHYKRNKSELNKINKHFSNKKDFIIDISIDNLKALSSSDVLITDNSGIFIEFLFVINKPVIFFDKFDKVHNGEYSYGNDNTFENILKKKFCTNYIDPDFSNISQYVSLSKKKLLDKNLEIEKYIKENIYNFGNASSEAIKIFKV